MAPQHKLVFQETLRLANGSKGFALYDYSNTANPLKAISLVTDTAAVDAATNGKLNYQFMARIGESNNDLIQATGTVSVTAGLPEVIGSSTTFTSDFTEGDIIAIDTAGATRFMGRVIEVAVILILLWIVVQQELLVVKLFTNKD